MFCGKSYQILKNCWNGMQIIVAGGVHWYIEQEQTVQMDQMGIV